MKLIADRYAEFARGWPIVLSAALGIGLGLSPVPFYTIGMFAPELAQAFGWGFGQIMLGLTVMTVAVLLASPLVGMLADRYGVRPVALISLALFALSFALFAAGNGSLLLFYCCWGLMAVLGAGTLPTTWTRSVNVWFEQNKGLALGLSMIGTGVFGVLIKPLTAWLILTVGWRGAYLAIALLPLLIALPVAWRCFRDSPTDAAVKRVAVSRQPVAAAALSGMSFGEVLRDWRFWVMCTALVPISFATSGPIPNMENILGTAGFSKLEIAQLVPVIGLSVLVGRILGGWLLDHFWAPAIAFVMLSLPALACWLLAHGPLNFSTAMLSIFLIGFAAGVEYDLFAFLVARYFGMKSYSTTYGVLYGCFALGAGIGPVAFGTLFDRTHSYAGVLMVSMGVLLAGATLLLTLGRYRNFATAESAASAAGPGETSVGNPSSI